MYPLSGKLRETIERNFTYHPPGGNQADRYSEIRFKCGELATVIALNTPESREQSLALTKLEEAVFWANAAIARHEHWQGGSLIETPKPPVPATSNIDDLLDRCVALNERVDAMLARISPAEQAGTAPTPATTKKGKAKPAPETPPSIPQEGEHAHGDA